MTAEIGIRNEVCGYYKIEAVKKMADGREHSRVLSDWFPNLITDAGLEHMATSSSWLNYCQVGSGNSAPTFTDTSLQSRIASTSSLTSTNNGVTSSPPYYAYCTRVFEFAEGAAAGNLSEVGVGWASSGSLFSRALILDGSGSPTTITVLPDEVLRVTYQFRFYVPTADTTGQLTLNGVVYNWTARASSFSTYGWGGRAPADMGVDVGNTNYPRAYSGNIASSVTGSPSGSYSVRSSVVSYPYSAGSLQRGGQAIWDLNRGNIGGIRSIEFLFGIGLYQVEFSSADANQDPIPKDATKILTLDFQHSWGRRDI